MQATGKKKPNQYSAEFKIEAVKMVIEQKYKQCEVARNLGVRPTVLNRWVLAFKAQGQNAFPGHGKCAPDEQRIRDLEAQVKRLTMEREILKKAITYFGETP
jgi:transposase